MARYEITYYTTSGPFVASSETSKGAAEVLAEATQKTVGSHTLFDVAGGAISINNKHLVAIQVKEL